MFRFSRSVPIMFITVLFVFPLFAMEEVDKDKIPEKYLKAPAGSKLPNGVTIWDVPQAMPEIKKRANHLWVVEMVREVAEEEGNIREMAESLQSVISDIEKISGASTEIHGNLKKYADKADDVISNSRALVESLEQIRDASREQLKSVDETRNSISRFDESANSVSSGSEELSATSEEIAGNAEKLKELIDEFRF